MKKQGSVTPVVGSPLLFFDSGINQFDQSRKATKPFISEIDDIIEMRKEAMSTITA